LLKEQISGAALEVLVQDGLEKWTVSAVADHAGCAKGLVHYHHKTKEQLLATAADQLARARAEDRLGALRTGGTEALDALWNILVTTASTGRTRAWLSLLGHSSDRVHQAARLPADYPVHLAASIAGAFGLESVEEPVARSIDAALDGFELALVRGDDADQVHESFHQTWLSVL
jgi:AcrR family transcriptional regulator